MRVWLKEIRESEKLTQFQVSQMARIDVTSISKYELGERRPSSEVVKKIARILNFNSYDIDWTKFFEDEPSTA